MTNNMKRFAAFVMCLAMVLACVPALASEGVTITGGIGLGGLGITLEEETTSGVTPAGPVLGQSVNLELTIGVPKTFSVYGFDYTNVKDFFDDRPDMKVAVQEPVAVPDVFVNNTQVYLYDVTLEAGALYLDSLYPSNVVIYDGENDPYSTGCNWTLKVIANTAPANLIPKGQLLDEVDETINAAIGKNKTVSFYGFDYTSPNNFFNDETVEVTYERFPVPGVYANGSHAVYLYNMTIKLNQAYNEGDGGRLYTNNIVYYKDNVATLSYYDNWRINMSDDVEEDETIVTETSVEEIDLSNVQLLVTSNLDGQERVKMGTEMVLTATLVNAEGLDMVIWWQQSTDDGQTWTDIPGAVGSQYKEIITRENAKMTWRAVADLVQNYAAE